ncbi:magnesium/cobalt transporter CorA [Mumia sp. ZJ430]|uniref:magnesium/cobalt transporter CorA n=1 Tax=Mumia sp. ZJ430 TaxID=2708083 RepID=UPI00141FF618|nr:magnesium/cobalt transporter CorA [Mumia sp. ZJ430]
MILDCAAYHDGTSLPAGLQIDDLADAMAACTGPADFVWLFMQDPTYEEFGQLQKVFGLHPLAVEDAVTAHQRPKVDVYPESAFLVLRALRYVQASERVEASEISLFLGDRYVIVVRHGDWPKLEGVRARAEKEQALAQYGAIAAAYHVIDAVVDEYEVIAESLSADVEDVEAAVFSDDVSGADTTQIYLLKRELLEFRRSVVPIHAPLQEVLRRRATISVPKGMLPYFRDVADHLAHARGTMESLDGLLDNVMQARATQISVQQNDDMRKLAAYAAMIAAPTLIAGVYGMNFRDMPELDWRFGYPLTLLAMVAMVALLWRAFKRSGWL